MKLNKIYNMDCYDGIKNISDNSIDLIVIDPPYIIDIHKGQKDTNGLSKKIKKIGAELTDKNLTDGYDLKLLDELVRVMKTINIYIWCSGKQIPAYIDFFIKNHNCNMEVLIWNKTNAVPLFNNKYLNDKEYCLYFRKKGYCKPNGYSDAKTVYTLPINLKDKKIWKHPTIKPLSIIRTIIRNSSKETEIVLDCFAGSGTTAVACILENRNYICYEINKEYYNIAEKRIEEAEESLND
jgi:DNA modification methylase